MILFTICVRLFIIRKICLLTVTHKEQADYSVVFSDFLSFIEKIQGKGSDRQWLKQHGRDFHIFMVQCIYRSGSERKKSCRTQKSKKQFHDFFEEIFGHRTVKIC